MGEFRSLGGRIHGCLSLSIVSYQFYLFLLIIGVSVAAYTSLRHPARVKTNGNSQKNTSPDFTFIFFSQTEIKMNMA
jgi:hypothetical protein